MRFQSLKCMLHQRRTRSILRWSRYLFFAVGVLALSYVGYVMLDANLYQAYQTRRFERALESVKPAIGHVEQVRSSPLPAAADAGRARVVRAAPEGFPLGQIKIRSIGLTAMIAEGDTAGVLRRAVGHVPGTALPGQQGNVVIAGHRDTFFRPLRNIRKGDEITLTTLSGSYRYQVDSTEIVGPEDTAVLDASPGTILTLVTCYPFYYVGPAPKRFIVRAHQVVR
ncbi:MAG TPA: class D sortase [Patescibacteria group bacterium]|nr:class D sortase [Patescibacteria group bacterium]